MRVSEECEMRCCGNRKKDKVRALFSWVLGVVGKLEEWFDVVGILVNCGSVKTLKDALEQPGCDMIVAN